MAQWASGEIEVDGFITEADWQQADVADQFVQTDPVEGAPTTEPTRVRVLYDSKKLYVGFECLDSEPDRIVANEMRRDGRLHRNDNVYVLLDTYNDKRSGFFFRVNPLGAMEDVLISDGGNRINQNWDAVWECKTARHDWGWSAEIAIPFNQLRFKRSEDMIWGLNFGRTIQRKREESSWSSVPRAYGYMGRYRTSNLGQLAGLKEIPASRHLEILPYLLPGATVVRQSEPETESVLKTGLDMKYGITSNLTADLTFNTDFAQIEADEEQVNLTRFSLFFPEKRPFFLEGSGLFNFGSSSSGGPRGPLPMMLFYSRRIGLAEGEAVPIIFGSKITGKLGAYGLGLLNVLTDEKDDLKLPGANFSVLRLKRDILSRSNLGLILLNQQLIGQNQKGYDRALGLDFNLEPRHDLSFAGLWAKTNPSENVGQSDSAWYLSGEWRRQLFRVETSYLDIGDRFEPQLGFVPRTGIRKLDADFRLIPVPHKYGIRRIYAGPEVSFTFDYNGRLQTRTLELMSWLEMEKGGRISFRVERNFERLDEDFEIRSNVMIPTGTYEFTSYQASISTDEGKMLSGEFRAQSGSFFDGQRRGAGMEAQFRPNGRLSWQWRYSHNKVDLPGGSFSTNLLSSRLNYSFSTTLFAKLFAQWNDSRDLISTNLLFNYIYRPGSNFYLVFNQGWDTSGNRTQVLDTTLLAKVTYLWNL
jgi:hypothetical protein